MIHPPTRAVPLVLLLLACCQFNSSSRAVVTCVRDGECPADTHCQLPLHECVADDGTPATGRSISPQFARSGVNLVASFASTASIKTATLTLVTAGGERLGGFVAGANTGDTHTWTYSVQGTEAEGRATVLVDLLLTDGRWLPGLELGATTLDFTPPALTRQLLQLQADQANPLVSVGYADALSAARPGTLVDVRFVASEPLARDPVPRLPEAAGPVVFTRVSAGSEWPSAFIAVTPVAGVEGTWPVSVELEDLAGNRAVAGLGQVLFDFTPPAAPATAIEGLLTFRRAPSGTLEAPGVQRFTLRGGPGAVPGRGIIRALARGYPVGAAASDDAGAFDQTALSVLADTIDLSVEFLDFAGNVSPPVPVQNVELVQLLGADAGLSASTRSVSSPCRTWTQDLPATPPITVGGGYNQVLMRAAGSVPVGLGTGAWFDTRTQQLVAVVQEGPTTVSTFRWTPSGWTRSHQTSLYAPWNGPGWSLETALYDSASGTPLVVAVSDWGNTNTQGTVQLLEAREDGDVNACLFSPNLWVGNRVDESAWAVYGRGAAFDALRGRVVLFGGNVFRGNGGLPPLTYTYRPNATAGREAPVELPLADSAEPRFRAGHAMGYDPLRDQVVVFGGVGDAGLLRDTWALSNDQWRNVTPAGSPAPRLNASMAWDGDRGALILHGGQLSAQPSAADLLDDTWAWDGTRWTRLAQGPRVARAGFAWSPLDHRLVLVGGRGGLNDAGVGPVSETWFLEGNAWRLFDAGPPPGTQLKTLDLTSPPELGGGAYPVERAAAVFDEQAQAATLFGGQATWVQGPCLECDSVPPVPFVAAEAWRWNQGLSFVRVDPDGGLAGRRNSVVAATAPGELTVLWGEDLDGGLRTDGFRLRDGGWTPVGLNGPEARASAGAALRPDGTLLVHGGRVADGGVSGETWALLGTSWSLVSSAGPAATASASWEPANNRLVVAADDQGFYGLAGGTWRALNDAKPRGGTLAYDPRRRETVYLGGVGDGGSGLWALRDGGLEPLLPDLQAMTLVDDPVRGRLEAFLPGGAPVLLEATAQRPAVVLRAPLAEVFGGATGRFATLEVRLVTGAVGEVDGGVVTGAEVLAWTQPGWERLPNATNSAPPGAADFLSWRTSSAATVRRFDADPDLSLMVQPLAANGTGTARLVVERAEVTLGAYLPAERGDGG